MHYNPFLKGPFVMSVFETLLHADYISDFGENRYLVALTIDPTFFTASI
jgi:hypothetical protein